MKSSILLLFFLDPRGSSKKIRGRGEGGKRTNDVLTVQKFSVKVQSSYGNKELSLQIFSLCRIINISAVVLLKIYFLYIMHITALT